MHSKRRREPDEKFAETYDRSCRLEEDFVTIEGFDDVISDDDVPGSVVVAQSAPVKVRCIEAHDVTYDVLWIVSGF